MNETTVFEGKNFSGLLKDIHDNAVTKRESINKIITQLVGMIKTSDDAIVFAPIIREFMDVGVKNDDHVIKIATIIQRMISAETSASNSGELLSEAEKEQLLQNTIQDINVAVRGVDAELREVTDKLGDVRG
jgi:hypothetical protein